MSLSLPFFPEPMVKMWPSSAPSSNALQGMVTKVLLAWLPWPWPRPLLPPFPHVPHGWHPLFNPCQVESLRFSSCEISTDSLQTSVESVGGSTTPSYLSVLYVSVDWAPSLNRCVALTLFLIALLLSIHHSTNYEVSSVKPWKI
jgi:hypothetical protein